MNAIAGVWGTGGRPAASALRGMLCALARYGPDGEDNWAKGEVALGRRAMHAVTGGALDPQPLIGGGGRFVLVADARLDNRDELAEALGIDRPLARSLADAAFILRAFERWGEECPHHLYGDYAFSIWDGARQEWFLARDALGGKPLHYFRGAGLFAFATMPKGLHALPEVPYEPDEALFARALNHLPPPSDASGYLHVRRVGPGECVTVTRDAQTVRRHWNPAPPILHLRRAADYREALREQLDRAVRVRLPETGDVASHLSAGLDSSAVAATAARLLAPQGRRVIAFTAVPREGTRERSASGRLYDEGPTAAVTAALYDNMDHVRVPGGRRGLLDALPDAFDLYEQPILNLCNRVWQDEISERASRLGLSVLLTGQMGNLTLSYSAARPLRERLQGRGAVIGEVRSLAWLLRAQDLRRIGGAIATFPGLLRRRAGLGNKPSSLLNPARLADLGASSNTPKERFPDSRRTRLAAFGRIDLANYSKGVLARWRIEERDPTADRRLVEFCLSVPDEQFRLGGVPSALARTALTDRLPRVVLRLRAKALQAVDWHAALIDPQRQLLAEAGKLAACSETERLLDLQQFRERVEAWPAHGWDEPNVAQVYRLGLLRAVSMGDFLRRAVKARSGRARAASA